MNTRILAASAAGGVLVASLAVAAHHPARSARTVRPPVAVVVSSVDAIPRELRRLTLEHPGAAGIVLRLRPGVYRIRRPLILTGADTRLPVTIEPAGGAVTITGAVDAGPWRPAADARISAQSRGRVLCADLRALRIDYGRLAAHGFTTGAESVAPAELFASGRRMTPARWPNTGWALTVGPAAGGFAYAGDRPGRWVREPDAWAHGYWGWDWADDSVHIGRVDMAGHRIVVDGKGSGYGYGRGRRWFAENILSEIDAPGEWYLDRAAGRAYFWPPAGWRGHAEVSTATGLVVLMGASNTTLRGLTLAGCRGDAVRIDGGDHNTVDRCAIANVGGTAVVVDGAESSGVSACDIRDTGAGAVVIRAGDRQTLRPGRCFVSRCAIHDYARREWCYRPGVDIYGAGNRVDGCRIYDAPHEAVQVAGNDNAVERCEIFRVCRGAGDSGAFYMGRDWSARGNAVRGCYFHDIGRADRLAGPARLTTVSAVYLDDMASGAAIVGNRFERVDHGVTVAGGRDNIVSGNVFRDCWTAVLLDARGQEWIAENPAMLATMRARLAVVPYNSPPWSVRYPELAGILGDRPACPLHNAITGNAATGCREGLYIRPGSGFRGTARIEGNRWS